MVLLITSKRKKYDVLSNVPVTRRIAQSIWLDFDPVTKLRLCPKNQIHPDYAPYSLKSNFPQIPCMLAVRKNSQIAIIFNGSLEFDFLDKRVRSQNCAWKKRRRRRKRKRKEEEEEICQHWYRFLIYRLQETHKPNLKEITWKMAKFIFLLYIVYSILIN